MPAIARAFQRVFTLNLNYLKLMHLLGHPPAPALTRRPLTSAHEAPGASTVILSMRKAFGLRASTPQGDFTAREAFNFRMPLDDVRLRMREALTDCAGMDAQRLLFKVQAAQTADALWMLRSDLYNCIARHHSQSQATQRINALLPCFEGWLPSRQLVRV